MSRDSVPGEDGGNVDTFRASFADLPPDTVRHALGWFETADVFPRPISIHWNLTLRCTARCVHCTQWAWPPVGELNLGQIESVVATFARWGVKTVTLGGGNPLLHPNFADAVAFAAGAGMKVGVITEGLRLSDEHCRSISDHVDWIRFSLDGPTASVHDDIRNAPGLFALATDAIATLSSSRRVQVGLNTVVQRKNLRSLSGMIPLAEELGVARLLFKISHGHDSSHRYVLTADEWKQLCDWAEENAARRTRVETNLALFAELLRTVFTEADAVDGAPVRSFYQRNQIHCFVPLFFLICDSRGDIYPCDYLQGDTRPWASFQAMRSQFCLGNILTDGDAVLHRLANRFASDIHDLPRSGYPECGCCTRFCQINASLEKILSNQHSQPATKPSMTVFPFL